MAKTILFTGGHHNSALVVALELKKRGFNVIWVGHKFTMKGDKTVSAEFLEVTKNQISFFELKTGKFYRKKNPLEYFKIAFGFFQSFFILLSHRPDLIVSFGGYLSVPVVITGAFLGIPAVTHEQTVTAGWANKAITPFVKKIFLTHASSLKNYPKNKTLVTGLPVNLDLLISTPVKKPKIPIIYITCGKQGSQTVNQAIFPLIPDLVNHYQVVHQTGAHTISTDQDKARRVKKSLPASLQKRYLHQPYFFGADAAKYLKSARIVISRSGAHTVYELLLLNKKSIVIPIPWVSHNEQENNALLLARRGNTIVLPEAELTSESLSMSIKKLSQQKLVKNDQAVITDATSRVIDQIELLLK